MDTFIHIRCGRRGFGCHSAELISVAGGSWTFILITCSATWFRFSDSWVFEPPSRPVWSAGILATFFARVSQGGVTAALKAPTCGECGVRFIAHRRLRAWLHVFDNLYTTVRCYRSTNFGCVHSSRCIGESISVQVAKACMFEFWPR